MCSDTIGQALDERDRTRRNLFGPTDDLPHQTMFDCEGAIRRLAKDLYENLTALGDEGRWNEVQDVTAKWIAEGKYFLT